MASPEHLLLTRMIKHGDIKDVINWGISEEDFELPECRAIWLTLLGYYDNPQTRNSSVPEDQFRNNFPHFELVDAPHTATVALCKEVRENHLRIVLRKQLVEIAAQVEIDPIIAAQQLGDLSQSTLSRGVTTCTDVLMSEHIGRLLHNYDLKARGLITPVMHWPWTPLSEETGGVSEGDYVMFWGRPKSKKTFVLNYVMADAYFVQEKRVLCYTKEMTPDNMLLRVAAFIGQLPYRETRLAKLLPDDFQRLASLQDLVKQRAYESKGRNELIILDGRDANGKDGVRWLRSRINHYKPDILFVDGLYLLHDDIGGKNTAENLRIQHISRNTRQMCLDTKVPCIATMQANRAASKNEEAALDEVAYSDAIGQDITQGFRVINERGGPTPTIALVSGGSREYSLHGIRINGVPCQDFSFHSVMSDQDIDNSKKADDKKHAVSAAVQPKAPKGSKKPSAPYSGVQDQLGGLLTGL